MLPFGHMGIGYQLARALPRVFTRNLRARWILVGTLLPDLLDKSLYYGSTLAFGREATERGLITGTRTFGHTLCAVFVVLAAGIFRRSPAPVALGLGMATHLLLDCGSKLAGQSGGTGIYLTSIVCWPAGGWRFPQIFDGYTVDSLHNPLVLLVEGIGLTLLARQSLKEWRAR